MTLDTAPRHLLTLVLALSLITVAAGCELQEAALDQLDVEASVNVDMADPDASATVTSDIPFSGQRIVVDNPLGAIDIETVEDPGYVAVRPTIRVEAVKNVKGMDLSDLQVRTEQRADETRIRVTTAIDSLRNAPDDEAAPSADKPLGWVDFHIRLPQDAVVTLSQNVGPINAVGFRGELTATTDVGEIQVRNAETAAMSLRTEVGTLSVASSSIDGDLVLESSAGKARVADVRFGQAEIETQAGEANIKDVRGRSLQVSTQLGEISVVGAEVTELDLSSQMGEISLQDTRSSQGNVRTQWGRINVKLGLDAVPRIRASTQAGGVSVYRLPPAYRSALQRGGSWLGESIELNPADARGELDLKTQLGDIQIVFPEATLQ